MITCTGSNSTQIPYWHNVYILGALTQASSLASIHRWCTYMVTTSQDDRWLKLLSEYQLWPSMYILNQGKKWHHPLECLNFIFCQYILICVSESTHTFITVIVVEMESVIRVQILDKAGCFLHRANDLGKNMNSSVPSI